ncbi:MAG: hypothetical protein AB9835_06385 [Eubacteriales bacterium]
MSDTKDKEKIKKYADKKTVPSFITYPLADDSERDPDSNTTIPSLRAVVELKDWVDFNKL